MEKLLLCLLVLSGLSACIPQKEVEQEELDIPQYPSTYIYNRVLGVLVGSAAGDAMGAPTEMWSRHQIQAEYGFVDSLTDHVREPSPEGTWDYNLHRGGTTDDTRWKVLMADFMARQDYPYPLSRKAFAAHILRYYDEYQKSLKDLNGRDPEPYERALEKMLWLKEWVRVAEAFVSDSGKAHYDALSGFYGGEMVCAGVLFAPSVGMMYPGAPRIAYEQSYEIDIFDLGYARDIAGLSAAMVSAAMDSAATPDSILATLRQIDPHHFFKGRLIGRTSYTLYRQARSIALECGRINPGEFLKEHKVKLALPLKTRADSMKYAQWSLAYELLDAQTRMYPFHPAEIHLVCLTALLVGKFDFRDVLAFIVNYGRDNDTTAALAGAILGAYHGYNGIPKNIREAVLASQKKMGADLEDLARELVWVMGN